MFICFTLSQCFLLQIPSLSSLLHPEYFVHQTQRRVFVCCCKPAASCFPLCVSLKTPLSASRVPYADISPKLGEKERNILFFGKRSGLFLLFVQYRRVRDWSGYPFFQSSGCLVLKSIPLYFPLRQGGQRKKRYERKARPDAGGERPEEVQSSEFKVQSFEFRVRCCCRCAKSYGAASVPSVAGQAVPHSLAEPCYQSCFVQEGFVF